MAMELRSGIVRHVTTWAETAPGRGWCSVAYFSLDGRPARLVCVRLKPYSRTALPAPFSVGDPLVIWGKFDAAEGRFDAACARLVNQRRTIDGSQAKAAFICGMVFLVQGALIMLDALSSHAHRGILVIAPIPGGLGLLLLVTGIRRLKALRLVEAVAATLPVL